MTQNERVLEYLERHPQGLTQYEAQWKLGIGRLASRVCDLRKDGCRISSERIKVPTRYGKPAYVSKYKLVGDKENEQN